MKEAETTSEEVLKSSLLQRIPVCFRFCAEGLSLINIGLDKERLATEHYLSSSLVREQVSTCSSKLSGKKNLANRLKRADLESFFTIDDDYPSESSLQIE